MPASLDAFQDINGVNNNIQSEIILKSSYRVSVCLKRYFTDIRALSYVLISRKKTVKWLEKKIRKLFNVHGSFVLTTRGHMLPSSERLGLLNADDKVEVIPNKIASEFQKQEILCGQAICNNVKNKNISDECDSATNQGQKTTPNTTTMQDDSSKEFELEQIVIPNKKEKLQNQIDSVQSVCNNVLDIENENITTDECDTVIIQKQKYSSCELKHSTMAFDLEQSVCDDTSMNSNTQNESTEEVQDVLEKVKRNALALLDNSYVCSQESQSVNSTRGTRKRKRVRRRRQQLVLSAEMPENIFEEESLMNDLPNNGDTSFCVTETSKTIPSVAILHNEEVCIRKPRIVQSIVEAT